MKNFKIVLVGESGAGKTNLLLRITNNDFDVNFKSTIGVEFGVKTIHETSSKNPVKLQIWDTAGQERFRSITNAYYRNASAVLLVFEMENEWPGLEKKLEQWLKDVRFHTPYVPIFLVRNKCDLDAPNAFRLHTEALTQFVHKHCLTAFYEVSARNNVGVHELFKHVADTVYSQDLISEKVFIHASSSLSKEDKSSCSC